MAIIDTTAALARFKIEAVAPIGKRKTFGHLHTVDGPHQWGEFELDEYPPSPEGEGFCALRRELDLTLGEAARHLGLRASVVSGLEHGRYRGDWGELEQALRDGTSKAGES